MSAFQEFHEIVWLLVSVALVLLLLRMISKLQQIEPRMRAIEDTARDGIVSIDERGSIETMNVVAARIFACGPEELIGRNITTLFPSERRGQPGAVCGTCTEIEGRRKDGRTVPIERTITEVRLPDRRTFTWIIRDLTDRSWATDALLEAYAQTEGLLSSISSILIGVDGSGCVTRWNKTAETTFGIPANEAIGRPFIRCGIMWSDSGVAEQILQCRENGEPVRTSDLPFKDNDGRDRLIGVTVSSVRRNDGAELGFLILGRDLTESRILERTLREAQKLEAIGQLAAGVAHEINTPMQYIGDNTDYLKKSFGRLARVLGKYRDLLEAAKSGKVTAEVLDEVEVAIQEARVESLSEEIIEAISDTQEGIRSVTNIVRAMKQFAHPDDGEKSDVDINELVASTVTVSRNEWKYVAETVTDSDPDLPLVHCSPGEISQVILNLIVNAAHAIAEVVHDGSQGMGTISVSTRRAGKHVEIQVRDTGNGIPESIRERIFDAFFTTKEVGKGTGQGLALAHTIVAERHGGTLHFESKIGQGTTFIVRLPIRCNAPSSSSGTEKSEPLEEADDSAGSLTREDSALLASNLV